MKATVAFLFLLNGLLVQGCVYVPGIETTDLSVLENEERTQAGVETDLGEPIDAYMKENYLIQIYAYDAGARGDFELAPDDGAPFLWLAVPFVYGLKKADQKRYVAIFYNLDNTMAFYMLHRDKDALERLVDELTGLVARSAEGDVEAQWELGNFRHVYGKFYRVRWLCYAAHGGHSAARQLLGIYYSDGEEGLRVDRVKSYVWFKLAAEAGHGHATVQSDFLVRMMTPIQIAEAERLADEWKPNPTECEVRALAASQASSSKRHWNLFLSSHDDQERWSHLCLSAQGGYPKGQAQMGQYYHYGLSGKPKDPVRAFMWYSLAEMSGDTAIYRLKDLILSEMTQDQIAEAERLAAEWTPNPAECE
jgi:TPR repeat protein